MSNEEILMKLVDLMYEVNPYHDQTHDRGIARRNEFDAVLHNIEMTLRYRDV